LKRINKGKENEEDVSSYFIETRTYWNLKDEALDRTVWRTPFERGYGPVARQTAQ
jgi:hypothetical protein